jgi:heme exporter protein C
MVYLRTRNLKWDAFAVSVIEVGLAFGAVNLITGMIWARIIWGIWWTWDWRLTSMLVCWLLYAGYLMLRRAIEEPLQRAKASAVFNIFIFADVPIVFFSIKWWRTQHPQPVVWGGGAMDPGMKAVLYSNVLPILIIGILFAVVRLRQEHAKREIESLDRHRARGVAADRGQGHDRPGRALRLRLRHLHAARRPGGARGRALPEAVPGRQARGPHRRHWQACTTAPTGATARC